ncbi:MAG: SurA N-terminal domain-containing protein [Acidobacteriota bacterium]
MLDVMRRNIKSLAVTLWAVIGAFIIFIFVDWGMGRVDQPTGKSVVAMVNDQPITADAYREMYFSQLRRMRDMFGGRLDRNMIRQLNIESSVLESLVAEEIMVQEAARMGFAVTDEELRDAIVNNPSFQDNGRFIGAAQYERLLMMNHKTIPQFEAELRRQLLANKLRQVVTMPLSVSDADVRDSYYQSHEKVKIAYVLFKSVPDLMDLTDSELRAYFDKNRSQFDIPERRKGRYLVMEIERVRQQVNVTQKDIENYYSEHYDQWKVEEEVLAQRITIKSDKRSSDEARALVVKLLDRARKGEDFAKLARENSEDEVAAGGGDMGPIQRGGLSPVEEIAVFGAPEGTTTEPIETDGGWAIYKINKKTPASVRSLQEAEPQIRSVLSWERAREAMDKKVTEILKVAQESKSLDKAAQSSGLTVKESPFLAKGDEFPALADGGQFSQALFEAKQGEISGPLQLGASSVIYAYVASEAPRPAKFEEVAEKVKKALSAVKRKEEALAKAQEAMNAIGAGAKPEDVAKSRGAEVKDYEFARNSFIPDLGSSSYIDDRAFSAEPGVWIGPFRVKDGACVFRVVQKTPVLAEEFEKEKDATRQTLLDEKRNKFFDAYLQLLRKKKRIVIQSQTLADLNQMLVARAG